MPSARRPTASRPMIESLEHRQLMAVQTPTNLNQNSTGSLREAIDLAKDGDTIDCTHLRGTIYIAWTIGINKNLTIVGPGSDKLAVEMVDSGGGRIFDIAGGLSTTISGLSIKAGRSVASWPDTNGGGMRVGGSLSTPNTLVLDDVDFKNNQAVASGGGLEAEFTDVTLTRCRFTGNAVTGTADAVGGAVHAVGGTFSATDCTFDNNSACVSGNVVDTSALGGAVSLMSAGDSTFTNCTFNKNVVTADIASVDGATATAVGGAINAAMYGNLTLLNNTFVGNTANGTGATTFGGGVSVLGFGTYNPDLPTVLTATNNVIAGNTADVGADAFGLDVSSDSTSNSLTYNVLGVADGSGITSGVAHNIAGAANNPLDAKLDPLTDNGGPVPTMLPRGGSPVLGVANAYLGPKLDARGYPRNAAYDVGAVEKQAEYSPVVTTTPDGYAAAMATYLGTVSATDVDGDGVTFSLVDAPAWLGLNDKGDGTAQLVGTPTVDDGGVADFVVRASDGTLAWDQPVSIIVDVSPVSLSDSGVLRVVGSDDADVIHVWQKAGSGGAVRVAVGNRIRNYPLDAVKAIEIYGRGGDDTIVANCVDLGSYVQAGYGDDTVVGSDNSDTITAAQGDDSVLAMGGDDWLDGNSGRDTLDGGDGNDRMYGGNGRDVMTGGSGNDVLYGEAGTNIYLVADRARDRIFGTEGAQDWVQAGDATKDLLYTGAVYL